MSFKILFKPFVQDVHMGQDAQLQKPAQVGHYVLNMIFRKNTGAATHMLLANLNQQQSPL